MPTPSGHDPCADSLLVLVGQQATLDGLSAAHGDHYRFQVDRRQPGRAARYIAIARSRGVSPALVMTDDPSELHAALNRWRREDGRAEGTASDQG
jgi:hypothetical protein